VSALSQAIKTPRIAVGTYSCKFTQVFVQLDEEDQVTVAESIALIRNDTGMGKSKQYSTSWLTKILRSFGYDISMSSVQRHVNKECSCERTGR
jgi:hypothetical protein